MSVASSSQTAGSVRSRLFRGSIAYLLSSVLQRTIAFLMLPLYTMAIEPNVYGQLSLLWTCTAVANVVLSFGLESAIFRGYYQLSADPGEREKYVNTVTVFLLVMPTAVVAVTTAIAFPFIRKWTALPPQYLIPGLLGSSAYVAATVAPLALLRAQERLKDYVKVNLTNVIVNTALLAALVLGLKLGAMGWVWANLISALVLLPVSLTTLGHRWSIRINVGHLTRALAYGLPLLPHTLSHWMLSVSDRLVLSGYVDLAKIGQYSLGYQLGAVLGIILTEINRAIMAEYGRAIEDAEHRPRLAKVVTYQALATAFLGLGMALLGPLVVRLFLPATYAGAADMIPWIALGYVFYGLYFIPMNMISMLAGNTKWVWSCTILAGLTNILCNVMTVPIWGTMAAAVNTAVGYAVLLTAMSVYVRATHGLMLQLNWTRITEGLAVVALIYVLAISTSPDVAIWAAVTRGAWVLFALPLLFLRELASGRPVVLLRGLISRFRQA